MRDKWKMRACGSGLSMQRPDNSLCVCLASWGRVSGRFLPRFKLHNSDWRHFWGGRKERTLFSDPWPEESVAFLPPPSCNAGHRVEESKSRMSPGSLHLAPIGGHTGIWDNEEPCRLEMHTVEIGKLLKAFHSKNVMFRGAPLACPLQFEENQPKKGGITPSKSGKAEATHKQVSPSLFHHLRAPQAYPVSDSRDSIL